MVRARRPWLRSLDTVLQSGTPISNSYSYQKIRILYTQQKLKAPDAPQRRLWKAKPSVLVPFPLAHQIESICRALGQSSWNHFIEESLGKLPFLLTSEHVFHTITRLSDRKQALRFFIWFNQHKPCILHCNHGLQKADGMHSACNVHGHDEVKASIALTYEAKTRCVMIEMWGHEKQFPAFLSVLDVYTRRSRASISPAQFNLLFKGFGWAGMSDAGLGAFQNMKIFNCEASAMHYNCLLGVLIKENCLDVALDLYKQMKAVGISPTLHTPSFMDVVWQTDLTGHQIS
ncbi:hypothetical protein L7F22_031684 [Adiantum nelumboides]|nr:hypothetical protein [Adiantum nelumboides]